MVVELEHKRILIDGVPSLLISGEIHYFRLKRSEWADRIARLKAAGGNTVASYIPWLCHELPSGEIDLDGHTRPELDLGAFIDLCAEHDLHFIARPGPFIMAELKNEGVPYRLYEDHPEIVPVSWDHQLASTRTLDYLAPAFLDAVHGWYGAVIPIVAARLPDRGGKVIGLQLDNEIGMLSWVSNMPDLTDDVVEDFGRWLVAQNGDREFIYPFVGHDPALFAQAIRSPRERYAPHLMRDLGAFMRDRFARYVATLRSYAEEFGISGIPFIINIHGTEAGGGETFPIGISQLFQSYTRTGGYLGGSDHYLGDLTSVNAPDLYLMNAFMDAVNRPEQPLTSMEFEAGEGDYGQTMGARLDPAAADFKLRISIVQGNRLINYYLFTGGVNYRMDLATGDGNDRISFTGERHGTNAPISPEGEPNYTLPRLARTNRMLASLADEIAIADEERDSVSVGFIPDYWMTESVYPKSAIMREIADDLRRVRFGGPGAGLARAMMHLTFRYGAVDIQNGPLDVAATPVLALASARYMAESIQRKLVSYLESGGQLFLYGEVPLFDMIGQPCRLLLKALGLRPIGMRWADHRYFLSLAADGWAAPRPELRAGFAQTFAADRGGVLFRVYGADEACGFDIEVGKGRAIVVSAEIPTDLTFFARAFADLGATPGLTHDHPRHGIFLSSAATPDGERFIHALNLDGFDKPVRLSEGGEPLFEGRTVMLRRRDGVMLPLGLDRGDVRVAWSTVEIAEWNDDGITVRLMGGDDAMLLESARTLSPGDGYEIAPRDGGALVTFTGRGTGDELLALRWSGS